MGDLKVFAKETHSIDVDTLESAKEMNTACLNVGTNTKILLQVCASGAKYFEFTKQNISHFAVPVLPYNFNILH